MYSEPEEVVKPNGSPIKMDSQWLVNKWWHLCYTYKTLHYYTVFLEGKIFYLFSFLTSSLYFSSHGNLSPHRYFLGKERCWVWSRLWRMLPGFLLLLMGSDIRWCSLSPRVVLSTRISVRTSARYTTLHQWSNDIEHSNLTLPLSTFQSGLQKLRSFQSKFRRWSCVFQLIMWIRTLKGWIYCEPKLGVF